MTVSRARHSDRKMVFQEERSYEHNMRKVPNDISS